MRNTIHKLAMYVCAAAVLTGVSACEFQKKMPTVPTPVEEPAPPAPQPEPGNQGPTEPQTPEPQVNRAPDPDPGQGCWDTAGHHRDNCIPLPDMYNVVRQVADEYPDALRSSCQEHGGSWEFMDRVVDRLRQHDTRWGYNWKRGNVGDPSLDAIAYHFTGGQDEGSRDVHVVDIILGHCGPNPAPGFMNVTNFHGAGAMWTGRGRF